VEGLKMKSKEQWVCNQIIDANRGQSLRIHNPNDAGLPIATNIPVDMIFAADILLRVMCYRGETSPQLRIYLSKGGDGGAMWNCEYGAIRTWSVTPWGALQRIGKQIEDLAEVTNNG
jgi:hypothetical protein